jgi:hypothetical protein
MDICYTGSILTNSNYILKLIFFLLQLSVSLSIWVSLLISTIIDSLCGCFHSCCSEYSISRLSIGASSSCCKLTSRLSTKKLTRPKISCLELNAAERNALTDLTKSNICGINGASPYYRQSEKPNSTLELISIARRVNSCVRKTFSRPNWIRNWYLNI